MPRGLLLSTYVIARFQHAVLRRRREGQVARPMRQASRRVASSIGRRKCCRFPGRACARARPCRPGLHGPSARMLKLGRRAIERGARRAHRRHLFRYAVSRRGEHYITFAADEAQHRHFYDIDCR